MDFFFFFWGGDAADLYLTCFTLKNIPAGAEINLRPAFETSYVVLGKVIVDRL